MIKYLYLTTVFAYPQSAFSSNLHNSAPRGSGQAVAMTIRGEKVAFYNCRFHGFQDTLCDGGKNHFYKDCYVEGRVDFVFGGGKTIFLHSDGKRSHRLPWPTVEEICPCYIRVFRFKSVVKLQGWSVDTASGYDRTVYFGEYKNWGPGSRMSRRVYYAKNLNDVDAKSFIKLEFISGSNWLLPPPKYTI